MQVCSSVIPTPNDASYGTNTQKEKHNAYIGRHLSFTMNSFSRNLTISIICGCIAALLLSAGTVGAVLTPDPPAAAFTGTPTSGTAPLVVNFTDTSTGDIFHWHWDFGDANTSSVQNPSHTYSSAGTYAVVLTVTGDGGSDILFSDSCIRVFGGECTRDIDCDDADPCTVDACDPATGTCVHIPVECDDADPCTVDACDPATGTCVHTPVSCDDGDPCTVDSCDPATGTCVHTPVSCDDGDPCTVGSCDPATGICSYILLAAMDDVYATDEQTPLAVPAPGVLANDLSGNFSVNFSGSIGITATLATTTAHGTLILNSNGSFVYTPVEGYAGTDLFTYRAVDGVAWSAPANVTITIVQANTPAPVPPRDDDGGDGFDYPPVTPIVTPAATQNETGGVNATVNEGSVTPTTAPGSPSHTGTPAAMTEAAHPPAEDATPVPTALPSPGFSGATIATGGMLAFLWSVFLNRRR